ncbi:hypothetical protein KUTeg_012469 [Tegillarca granosa]|uniref:G-protein coupled receptors family 1 profile domain-containing protein n=1 Tax=Tegillarca granosa TaxID=220873 RepID=A0ABQ9EZS9_TEGGR|nr:hypothetical protein KUTeg_012469 [Tegillarca granosa]
MTSSLNDTELSTENTFTEESTATITQSNVIVSLGSGYDLPVYGLDNGQFYFIHIPAMICIALSFFSAVTILIASFKMQNYRTFFCWTKSERFVVYLAICDGLFNIAHTVDHAHIAITKNHVYPRELCEFYGFMLAEFITAQNLMVNVVAINAFILIFFRKSFKFGKYDWKLLLWTFGAPFLGAMAAAFAGQLGPNGTFCYFDGVKGKITNICFTTIPLLVILVMNTALYFITWQRIRVEGKRLKNVLGNSAKSIRASHQAARTMSLFVIAFIAQWWAMALYGTWQLIDENVPLALFQFVTTFSNVGGILNGVVYIIIRRRKLRAIKDTEEGNVTDVQTLQSKSNRQN